MKKYSFLVILATILFISCKKDNNATSTCKIVDMVETSKGTGPITTFQDHRVISYNPNNKISSLIDYYTERDINNIIRTARTTTKDYSYDINKIIIRTTEMYVDTTNDTLFFNPNGFISRSGYSKFFYENTKYFYDNYNHLTLSTAGGDSIAYIWNNSGDVTTQIGYHHSSVRYVDSGNITYNSQNEQVGDLYVMNQILSLGVYCTINTHLVATQSGIAYTYQFDKDGKIISIIYSYGFTTDTTTYQYNCN